ncbi:MAG: hypothetical protein WKF41_19085 [Gaiellaceae bacterium]
MKLLAIVNEPQSITRYLAALGETTDVPSRSPSRGPPYLEKRRPAPQGARRGRVGAEAP